MICDNALAHLDQWLDGELSPQAATDVQSHVRQCPTCTLEWERRRQSNSEMRALIPGATAGIDEARVDRIFRNVRTAIDGLDENRSSRSTPTPSLLYSRWFQLLCATAAGFLIAITLIFPWRRIDRGTAEIIPVPFGSITVVAGELESKKPGSGQWTQPEVNGDVVIGCQLRTGESGGCELVNPSGGVFRFDCHTDVGIDSKNQLDLKEGRVWVQAPKNQSEVSVTSNGLTVSTSGSVDLKKTDGETELIAWDQPVTVNGQGWTKTVPMGHVAKIGPDDVMSQSPVEDFVLSTRWVHHILALKDRDPELASRVQQLCALLGKSKLDALYDDEIRSIGPAAALPLIAFLNASDAEHQDASARRRAAKLLADIATHQHAQPLADLLDDSDPGVVREIESGLRRVTGHDIGGSPRKVDGSKRHQWQNWLEKDTRQPSPWRGPSTTSPDGKKT